MANLNIPTPDATTTYTGKVQLTNNLGGTATAPTVIWDGWNASADTWTYASAQTFTIAGVDRTSVYTKGTRLKFTQTTVKYAVVISSTFSTNTTVTIATNTDYTIANAAISLNYYSYNANPPGYPGVFNFTPVVRQSGTLTTTTTYARYSVIGPIVTVNLNVVITSAGSAGIRVDADLPITAFNAGGDCMLGAIQYKDAGTGNYVGNIFFLSTTSIAGLKGGTAGNLIGADPSFTAANGDGLSYSAVYEMA